MLSNTGTKAPTHQPDTKMEETRASSEDRDASESPEGQDAVTDVQALTFSWCRQKRCYGYRSFSSTPVRASVSLATQASSTGD